MADELLVCVVHPDGHGHRKGECAECTHHDCAIADGEYHQRSIEIVPPGTDGCCSECKRKGLWVKIVEPAECELCFGDDDVGEPFCPVCQYCCGC